MTDWERLKGNLGREPCEGLSFGEGTVIDCITPPTSPECAETFRRLYACNALGLEMSIVPLAEHSCGFGVGTCLPENLAIIDGEPRDYQDTDDLWEAGADCQRERVDD